MKKMILSVAILLLAAFTVNTAVAQIGIRGGVGFANVKYTNGDIEFQPDAKIGLSVGISKEIKVLGKFLKLAPELMLDVKGSKKIGILPEILNSYYGVSYNYVGLGLGAKINVPVLPIYVLGQPYFQYLVSGQTVINLDGDVTRTKIDDFGDTKRTEFGLNLGLGATFNVGPLGLFLEARYAVPMTKLDEATTVDTYTTNIKNKYFTVSLGLLIGGK